MVTWIEIAEKYPNERIGIVEHLKGNIRFKKALMAFEHTEIGVMVKMRDGTESNALRDWARYFINLHLADIEDMTKGIEDDRREIAEIERLPGTRQGNLITGNAPDIEQAEGRTL